MRCRCLVVSGPPEVLEICHKPAASTSRLVEGILLRIFPVILPEVFTEEFPERLGEYVAPRNCG